MTEASQRALVGMRDFTTLQWYVVPLLAIVFYVYVMEIKKARASGVSSITERRSAAHPLAARARSSAATVSRP